MCDSGSTISVLKMTEMAQHREAEAIHGNVDELKERV